MKYQVTIEFETDEKIPFPIDATLLGDMQAQLESLEDGTYHDLHNLSDKKIKVLSVSAGKLVEVACNEDVLKCDDCGKTGKDVEPTTCPYQADVYNDPNVSAMLCRKCYSR